MYALLYEPLISEFRRVSILEISCRRKSDTQWQSMCLYICHREVICVDRKVTEGGTSLPRGNQLRMPGGNFILCQLLNGSYDLIFKFTPFIFTFARTQKIVYLLFVYSNLYKVCLRIYMYTHMHTYLPTYIYGILLKKFQRSTNFNKKLTKICVQCIKYKLNISTIS